MGKYVLMNYLLYKPNMGSNLLPMRDYGQSTIFNVKESRAPIKGLYKKSRVDFEPP